MADRTKIAWADMTWSPWIGCSKIASGCTNCYAEADFAIRRKRVVWGPQGTRVKTSDAYWKKPLAWNRRSGICQRCYGHGVVAVGLDSRDCPECKCTGVAPRFRVFPSLCDPFEDWTGEIVDASGHRLDKFDKEWRPATMNDLRCDMFKLIDATPNLDWLLLTKRHENIDRLWYCKGSDTPMGWFGKLTSDELASRQFYRDNVWLIYSASDQESFEKGIYNLTTTSLCPILGVSLEPLLGPIDLSIFVGALDWVIVGGESGSNARPCNVRWIRDIVSQCQQAGVPVFVKQLGSRAIYLGEGNQPQEMWPHFSDPKGGNPDEWPEDLRVQESPNVR